MLFWPFIGFLTLTIALLIVAIVFNVLYYRNPFPDRRNSSYFWFSIVFGILGIFGLIFTVFFLFKTPTMPTLSNQYDLTIRRVPSITGNYV
jgi:multisubunit Na+/H+ antiporter MnhB subunit